MSTSECRYCLWILPIPIVAEHSEKKRRAPWWVLALASSTLSLAGAFAWSWFRPIVIRNDNRLFVAGALYTVSGPRSGWSNLPDGWQFIIDLPGPNGIYTVMYRELQPSSI
jgi:hypothetical protein